MTEATAPAAATKTAAEVVQQIQAKRWFAIRRALDMPVSEIMEDMIAIMVVAAHETWKRTESNGGQLVVRDDWDRFLSMDITQLGEWIGVDVAEVMDQAQAAEKSGGS